MHWITSSGSSTVARFKYDGSLQQLDVEFVSGMTYRYYDVPEVVFTDMQTAASKGQFLAQQIKGRYRYTRL